MWSVAPPSATHLPSSRYRIFGLPHLVCFPFRPYPPPPPSTTPPSNPVVSATCACPGRGRGGCEGGGGGLEVAQCLPFDLRGGCAGLIASFLPLETQLRRFGVRNSTCVLEKGGEKKAGGPIRISAGLLCWYLFLVVSFFFFLLLWARFAGADCNFLLVFGYVSVGIYLQSQRDLFLKPKVRGLAVARPLSVCGGLPASACLDSRPSRGQDICPNLPRGC